LTSHCKHGPTKKLTRWRRLPAQRLRRHSRICTD
jgi:hypothetical protein